MIRIRFWGPLYYTYDKEPPKIVKVIIKAPIVPPTKPPKEVTPQVPSPKTLRL